jgi:hypothetical protein
VISWGLINQRLDNYKRLRLPTNSCIGRRPVVRAAVSLPGIGNLKSKEAGYLSMYLCMYLYNYTYN